MEESFNIDNYRLYLDNKILHLKRQLEDVEIRPDTATTPSYTFIRGKLEAYEEARNELNSRHE